VACDDISSPERLAVYYYSNSAASGSSIQMYFDVVNFTAFSARLAQVTVRYWFTDEDASSPNLLEQYYVPLPTTMKFTTLDPPRQGADTVLEISFTTAGDAGGTFVETRGFNFAFHKNGYSGNYDQTNDYSYAPDLKTSLGQNPKITAYINGALAWGCEPPIP
jgi:endoglucanase